MNAMFGLPPGVEVSYEAALAGIHPNDRANVDRAIRQALDPASGGAFAAEYRTVGLTDGVERWVSSRGRACFDAEGRATRVIGTAIEVTERRRAEEGLRRYAEELRAAQAGLRDLARRLHLAEEGERRRIARELHDEIGQALTAVKLNLWGALRDPASPAAARRLEEGIGLIERTIGQVRDLSLDLRPSLLDDLGLTEALRSYTSGFSQRSGTGTRFVARGEVGRLDPDVETACYRIAQEALTNVARHAGARSVVVELAREGETLSLAVADDGRGFDVETAEARAAGGSSLGVLGMRERADLAGGRLVIDASPGGGTVVRATFPLGAAGPPAGV
jgi:signal transduction histidine kinase